MIFLFNFFLANFEFLHAIGSSEIVMCYSCDGATLTQFVSLLKVAMTLSSNRFEQLGVSAVQKLAIVRP